MPYVNKMRYHTKRNWIQQTKLQRAIILILLSKVADEDIRMKVFDVRTYDLNMPPHISTWGRMFGSENIDKICHRTLKCAVAR